MALLERLLRSAKVTVHVLDYTHPEKYFTVKCRVPKRILREFGVGGELFASIDKDEQLRRVFPGFRIGKKSYSFMRRNFWIKLAQEYKRGRGAQLGKRRPLLHL